MSSPARAGLGIWAGFLGLPRAQSTGKSQEIRGKLLCTLLGRGATSSSQGVLCAGLDEQKLITVGIFLSGWSRKESFWVLLGSNCFNLGPFLPEPAPSRDVLFPAPPESFGVSVNSSRQKWLYVKTQIFLFLGGENTRAASS